MKKRGAESAGSKRRFCSRDDRTRSANPRGLGRLPAVVLALFLVVSTSLALDPRQSLGRFRLVRWDEDQGLLENYTSNIAQTRDGFMWLAFDHGLIRFDGKNFAAGEELHANLGLPTKVFGLVPGRSGELWIGSYKALFCRSANGEFKRFDHIDGLPDDYLSALFQDSEGTLWIGTDHSGLLQLKQGRFLTYPGSLQLAESYIYAMCETSQAFWVGTATGVYQIDKASSRIKKFTDQDGLPGNQVYGITTDRDGRVWAGTGKGLARFGNNSHFEAVNNELGHQPIQSLITDLHGMIWASGSSGGLWRIDPKTEEVSTLPEEADRPVPDIQSVYEDHEGNIWLATSLGLERLSDVQFTVYTARDGLPSDQITAVQAGKSGRIWAGTLGGLACITNGRIETIHTAGSTEVTSIHEDSQGTLWFGLRDATLHRLDQGKDQQIATLTIADQSGPGWAAGICDGPNGDLWIGTTGAGLHLFNKGDAVKTYTLADGLQDRSVFSLEIDRQQRLWIGEGEGVDLLRKSGIKAVRGENPQTVPIGVLSLHADANEIVWAGTDNGLYRFKNGRWGPIVYRPDQRMLGPEFYSLLEDNHDNLWSSGSRGIFFVSKHELKDFFDGKRSSVACHVFGKADGLRSPECTPGFPSACRSADGRLWFATTAGFPWLTQIISDPIRFRRRCKLKRWWWI